MTPLAFVQKWKTANLKEHSAAQEKNAKNVLIIRDEAVAALYMQKWQAHTQPSQP